MKPKQNNKLKTFGAQALKRMICAWGMNNPNFN